MPKPWSKLQKEFYLIRADGINFQLHCRRYRMDSAQGSTDCPRYWITLDKEVIWDYPKDFINRSHPDRAPTSWYPYSTDISAISNLIRDYIDTPKTELMNRVFEHDHWGLVNILRAADKRIGLRRLPALKRKTGNHAALKIIEARLAHRIISTENPKGI